jgi:hypothetical protein
MSDLTRRRFVKNSAAATAGATMLGALLAEGALAKPGPHGGEQMIAWVRDSAHGDISLLVGEREVRIRDQGLAARIARAAR